MGKNGKRGLTAVICAITVAVLAYLVGPDEALELFEGALDAYTKVVR